MLYEYQCQDHSCLHVTVAMRSVARRFDPIDCEKCGTDAKKVLSVPTRNWALKAEVDNYPMANPWLSKPGEPPVVFENATQRKNYYKEHGLVDAVTPESDRRTMYTDDGDSENYKDYSKFEDTANAAQYIRVPDSWEDAPEGVDNV